MSRDISSAVDTASQGGHVIIAHLARMAYDAADVLFTDAPFDIAWDWDGDGFAETFNGLGKLISISPVGEGVDYEARTMRFTLSGVEKSLVSTAMQEAYSGRECMLWLALLDTDHQLIDTPTVIWPGRIDTQDVVFSGKTASIQVTANSLLQDWERPRVRRYTNEDQQAQYPGDKGLEFVSETASKELIWGRQ